MKQFTPIRICLLSTLLLMSCAASAADIEDAIHAMRQGNFAEAYCILKPYAESGDADAQYNIGWMYLNGYGLAINDNLALEWWQRASDQGHTDASFSLGMLYSLGEGQVEKDMDKAIDYYLLAAEDDHEDARIIIKSMLLRNEPYIRDRAEQIINTYPWLGAKYRVKAKRLNVRNKPSLDGGIVKVLEQGDVVVELERNKQWSHIAVTGMNAVAWAYSALLEPFQSDALLDQDVKEESGASDEKPEVNESGVEAEKNNNNETGE